MTRLAVALRTSSRAALETLAADLAAQIDAAGGQRDLVPLVRAFLATLAQLDVVVRREARDAARTARQTPPAPDALDELTSRRERKRGRASG